MILHFTMGVWVRTERFELSTSWSLARRLCRLGYARMVPPEGFEPLKRVVLSHPGIPVPVTSAKVEPRGIEPLPSGCKPDMLVRYHQGPKVRAQGVEPCSSSLSAKCP